MCHKINIVNQTKNGCLLKCTIHQIFYLDFGHFSFEFTEDELSEFGSFIFQIDAAYWENKNYNCLMKRKIPIPTLQQNLCLMINRAELEELKKLVFYKEKEKWISMLEVKDVDYTFILN